MLNGQGTLSRMRHDAAPMLLGVFLLAAQLGPVVHLATHRPDHIHGPDLEALAAADHDAAHRAGRPHDHHDADRGRGPAAHGRSNPQRPPSLPHGQQNEAAHAPDGEDPSSSDPPIDDHGRESVAHFGVTLLEAPPPPIVPPPSEAIAPPADARPRWHSVPSRPQPPARGPPAPRPPQLPAA